MGEQGRSAQSSPQACPAHRPRLSAEETAPSLPAASGGAGWAIPHTAMQKLWIMQSERGMLNLHAWSFWLIFSQFKSQPLKNQQYFPLSAKQASFYLILRLFLINFLLRRHILDLIQHNLLLLHLPHRTTQMIRTFTPTTVRDLTYQATTLSNSDYSPSTRTDIQRTSLKGSLARINSGALAEDHLTSIHQAELQRVAGCKGTARVVHTKKRSDYGI